MITTKLAKGTWNQDDYYDQARVASQAEHPSLTFIQARYHDKNILEVGCGEGTKLARLQAKTRTGLDISRLAIKRAKTMLDFAVVGNAESLPFESNRFDGVLSFFSLEHFEHPELVIAEMLRVAKVGGEIVILTPNFGAPNRSSPCFVGSRLRKLIVGLITDFMPFQRNLAWNHVTPLSVDHRYESDFDTLVEPYLHSLIGYLKSQNLDIIVSSSNWAVAMQSEILLQKLFRVLGMWGIYPFTYWGPHAFVIARKKL